MKVHRHLESTGLKVRMMHRSRSDNNNCIETIDSSQAAQRVLYYIFIQPKEKNLSGLRMPHYMPYTCKGKACMKRMIYYIQV